MGDVTPFPPPPKRAWVTLLTRASYLPGAVLLAHSLHKNNSIYPLIILYTSSFPSHLLGTLAREAKLTNATLLCTEMLQPKDQGPLIAERFRDTWTKLRVFEMTGWKKLCFLDADMLVCRNMDEIFEAEFPTTGEGKRSWLAANHVCVCNLDRDSWAPNDWKKENCAFTGLRHPEALTEPCPASKDGTKSLLNSGLFLLEPSTELWKQILDFLDTSPLLKDFLFPDQDFLAEFFRGRWISIGWQYNALKTWRYWHPEIWRDEEVRNLHYIVDKPWSKRIGKDRKAGYLGKDGETHRWWWDEYERWVKERVEMDEKDILNMMGAYTASPLE
jgi:inositol 3-alpha-galactosyltransferase